MPEPTSRRRLFVILAVIGLVVIGLVVGSFLYASSAADGKASDYDNDFAAWKAKEKPALLAATVEVPDGTYVRKNSATAKGLAIQKKGCHAVAASRKKVAAAADRLPTMAKNGLLGKLSSDYSDAGKKSARREKAVGAYVKAASDTLAQLERDCRWNIAYNTSAVKPNKLWADSEKYLMHGSGSEPGATCSEKVCISSISKKKNTYADLRIRAIKERQKSTVALLKSKDCEATSYEQACRTLAKSIVTYLRASLDSYTYIRKAARTVGNDGIDAKQAIETKIAKAMTKVDRAALLRVAPDLKRFKDIKENPQWTDIFFARVGKLLLADLKDERASVEKL